MLRRFVVMNTQTLFVYVLGYYDAGQPTRLRSPLPFAQNRRVHGYRP